MACEAKSLDQNDARFTSSRQGFGSGRALPVIVQPVFEFRHPLFKTIKALPDNHGSRLSVSAPSVHGIPRLRRKCQLWRRLATAPNGF
jgi:hypothetical protein